MDMTKGRDLLTRYFPDFPEPVPPGESGAADAKTLTTKVVDLEDKLRERNMLIETMAQKLSRHEYIDFEALHNLTERNIQPPEGWDAVRPSTKAGLIGGVVFTGIMCLFGVAITASLGISIMSMALGLAVALLAAGMYWGAFAAIHFIPK